METAGFLIIMVHSRRLRAQLFVAWGCSRDDSAVKKSARERSVGAEQNANVFGPRVAGPRCASRGTNTHRSVPSKYPSGQQDLAFARSGSPQEDRVE